MSEPGSHSNLTTAIGGGAILALLASNIYLFVQLHDVKALNMKEQDAVTSRLQQLEDNTNTIEATTRHHYQSLSQDLDRRSREAMQSASSARTEALTQVQKTKQQLEQEQQQTAEKINSDLSNVKDTTNAKIEAVNSDVGNVKTQVSSTQADLQTTKSQLQKVQGDLGITVGDVAKNGGELAELKRRGERNYFEFNLSKSKQPQRVGDIQVLLRKADPKHNRFTLTVMADDKTIEKKDKTTNEPVQFYVAKAKQPYEIVVNTVRKDSISGYLATPKESLSR